MIKSKNSDKAHQRIHYKQEMGLTWKSAAVQDCPLKNFLGEKASGTG